MCSENSHRDKGRSVFAHPGPHWSLLPATPLRGNSTALPVTPQQQEGQLPCCFPGALRLGASVHPMCLPSPA